MQGSVSNKALFNVSSTSHSISDLTALLSVELNNHWVSDLVHLFTYVCITTSFLGVSLCMADFLADGLQVNKKGWHRWLVIALTFVPPLLIVIIYPDAFIKALSYAGLFCVILLMLLPGLMCWQTRYVRKLPQTYQFFGGKPVVALEILVSIVLILVGVLQLHW